MIRDGDAILVESARDVLDLLDLAGARHGKVPSGPADERAGLSATEKQVLDAMPTRSALSADALAAAAALPTCEVWSALGVLEAKGWVRQDASGWRLARLTRARRAD